MSLAKLIAAHIYVARLALTAALWASVTLPGCVLAGISTWALITTALAWMRGTPDESWTGVVVALGHMLVLLVHPVQAIGVWLWAYWILAAVHVTVRWNLGVRCTVTGPVFVGVTHQGWYKLVRHPMTAFEWLMIVAVVAQNPTLWNLFVLGLCSVGKVVITLCEERFLSTFPQYRAYMAQVPWRFCKGVW